MVFGKVKVAAMIAMCPDVYFISNRRILALYGRKIVFQGTPREL